MKIKFILSLRLIFYSALLLFCVLTFITYFQNKKILQSNNSVVLCVKSDLLTHYVNDESILKTEAANYINLLKKYGFSHILFDKITLRELIQNGFVTFVSGSDIINNKRICPPPPLDIERAANNSLNLKINPDYKYIISENKNLTEKIFDSLQENDITVHKMYPDSGVPFLQNYYYLEIKNIPDELPCINLFYQDNAIEYFKNSQFKIALLDPNKSDIKKYGGITDAYVLDDYSIDKINELPNLTGSSDYLIFKNNLIYKYPRLINKIKYLPITHTMLQRIKILDKSLRANIYQFIIYSPTSKLNEEFESELEILSDFFKNRKTAISDSIIRFELTPNLKISYVLCLIIIVSFYLIFIIKCESLLFLGNLGIAAAYSIYLYKMSFLTNHYVVWQTGMFQIMAIQILFFVIWEKQIINLVKGICFLFVFYYISVLSAGLYMFSLLDIPVFAKSIIVIFQLLSFIFGLYIYRKRFDNKFLFNSIQIVLMILAVMILFKGDMGLTNIFENFYNKIIRTILIIIN